MVNESSTFIWRDESVGSWELFFAIFTIQFIIINYNIDFHFRLNAEPSKNHNQAKEPAVEASEPTLLKEDSFFLILLF